MWVFTEKAVTAVLTAGVIDELLPNAVYYAKPI